MNLFRTKPVTAAPHVDAGEVHGGPEGEATLKRVLTARHLVLLGIGASVVAMGRVYGSARFTAQ